MSSHNLQTQFELFKSHFEDNLKDKNGNSITFDDAISSERGKKRKLVETVQKLIGDNTDTAKLGEEFYRSVDKYLASIYPTERAKINDLKKHDLPNHNRFCAILGNALLSTNQEDEIFSKTYDDISIYHSEKIPNAPSRSTLFHLLFVALTCKDDSKSIFGTVTFFGDVTEFFLGERLLSKSDPNIKQSFNSLNQIVSQLSEVMSSEWGCNILDNLDVQSTLWIEFRDNKPKYKAYLKTLNQNEKRTEKIKKLFESEIKQLPEKSEKLAYVKQRCGQSALRKILIDKYKCRCLVTGIRNKSLLRVSHIIPWKDCEDGAEQLDPNNCLLLSSLWDAAFDKGLISFDDGGSPIFSEELKEDKQTIAHFKAKTRIVLTEKQKENLSWHRKNVFKNHRK